MNRDRLSQEFSEFYRQYYSTILATCARRLGFDRCAAEDAAQEVFRIAWQRFSDSDPQLPWLYAIARNVIGNIYQRSAKENYLRSDSAQLIVAVSDERDTELMSAILRLSLANRELLFMTYWEDLTAKEIGEILDIPESRVWVRLSSAGYFAQTTR